MALSDTLNYDRLDALVREHGRLVVCTVVRCQGSVPRRVGSRMAVLPNGETRGTVGGGLFEAWVTADALAALTSGESVLKAYDFREEGASPDAFGAVCGGNLDLFLEVVSVPDRLLIVGGGHCGRALARAAVLLGTFQVTLVDDRPAFAAPGELPQAVTTVLSPPGFPDLAARVGPDTSVVLVSQGFATDLDALRHVVGTDAAYLGMMGSRRKVRHVLDALTVEGVSADALARVHAPIGLEIGAETPAEIAVSILAQIISVRASRLPHG